MEELSSLLLYLLDSEYKFQRKFLHLTTYYSKNMEAFRVRSV